MSLNKEVLAEPILNDDSACPIHLMIVSSQTYSREEKEIAIERIHNNLLQIGEPLLHIKDEMNSLIKSQSANSYNFDQEYRFVLREEASIQFELLINSTLKSFTNGLKSLIHSKSKNKYLICSTVNNNSTGDFLLQDSIFSLEDLNLLLKEDEAKRVANKESTPSSKINIYLNSNLVESNKNWKGVKNLNVITSVAKSELLNEKLNVTPFIESIRSIYNEKSIDQLIEISKFSGTLKITKPILYVFPSRQGDSAFFTINGYSMLINGGYDRVKPSFWRFVNMLHQIDSVLVTHSDSDALGGLTTFFSKKVTNPDIKPSILTILGNLIGSAKSENKNASLATNLIANEIASSPIADTQHESTHDSKTQLSEVDLILDAIDKLKIKLIPLIKSNDSPLTSKITPNAQSKYEHINLYYKLGQGSLDLYVLSPTANSPELKEFISQQQHSLSKILPFQKSQISLQQVTKNLPLSHLASSVVLLVWMPYSCSSSVSGKQAVGGSCNDNNALRLLFTGNAPQHVIFNALDKVKDFDLLHTPVYRVKSLEKNAPVINSKQNPKKSQNLNTTVNGSVNLNSSSSTNMTNGTKPNNAAANQEKKPNAGVSTTAPSNANQNAVSNGHTKPIVEKKEVTQAAAKPTATGTASAEKPNNVAASKPPKAQVPPATAAKKPQPKETAPANPTSKKPAAQPASHDSSFSKKKPAKEENHSEKDDKTPADKADKVDKPEKSEKVEKVEKKAAPAPLKSAAKKEPGDQKSAPKPSESAPSNSTSATSASHSRTSVSNSAALKNETNKAASAPKPASKPAPAPSKTGPTSTSSTTTANKEHSTSKKLSLPAKSADKDSKEKDKKEKDVNEQARIITKRNPKTTKEEPKPENPAEQNLTTTPAKEAEVLEQKVPELSAPVNNEVQEVTKETEVIESVETVAMNNEQPQISPEEVNLITEEVKQVPIENPLNGCENESEIQQNLNSSDKEIESQDLMTQGQSQEATDMVEQWSQLSPVKRDQYGQNLVELGDEIDDENPVASADDVPKSDLSSTNADVINAFENKQDISPIIELDKQESHDIQSNHNDMSDVKTEDLLGKFENDDVMTRSFIDDGSNPQSNPFITNNGHKAEVQQQNFDDSYQDLNKTHELSDEDNENKEKEEKLNEKDPFSLNDAPEVQDKLINEFMSLNIQSKVDKVEDNLLELNENKNINLENNIKKEEVITPQSNENQPATWSLLELPQPVNPNEFNGSVINGTPNGIDKNHSEPINGTNGVDKNDHNGLILNGSTNGVDKKLESSDKKPVKAKLGAEQPNNAKTAAAKQPAANVANKAHKAPIVNPVYLEVSYIPAHADPYYVDADFFKRVRARHYILSTEEPSEAILNHLIEAKETWEEKNLQVSIIPTYESEIIRRWFVNNEETLARLKIDVLPAANLATVTMDENPDLSCQVYKLEF